MTNSDRREKASPKLMLVDDREQLRAAEAVVDAAIWCQVIRGPVCVSDTDREFLVNLVKANPQLTGALFRNGGLNLS